MDREIQCSVHMKGSFILGRKRQPYCLDNQFYVHIEQRQRSKKKLDLSESGIAKGIYIKGKATTLPDGFIENPIL